MVTRRMQQIAGAAVYTIAALLGLLVISGLLWVILWLWRHLP